MMHREDCEICLKSNKGITVMSMFNAQIICLSCHEIEKDHPSYGVANKADINQIKKGNFNFGGIGLPSDLATQQNSNI